MQPTHHHFNPTAAPPRPDAPGRERGEHMDREARKETRKTHPNDIRRCLEQFKAQERRTIDTNAQLGLYYIRHTR